MPATPTLRYSARPSRNSGLSMRGMLLTSGDGSPLAGSTARWAGQANDPGRWPVGKWF